jgi:hypothetical protein
MILLKTLLDASSLLHTKNEKSGVDMKKKTINESSNLIYAFSETVWSLGVSVIGGALLA